MDPGGVVALEDGAVFGEGDLARRVLRRLPVRVVGAALHVVDCLAIELERDAQLDQRFHLALPRDDAVPRRLDAPQVAGADGGQPGPPRRLHVDHAPSGQVALERARRLFLDLRPGRIGNGSELAMQVIHVGCLL